MQSHKRKYPIANFMHQQKQQKQRVKMSTTAPSIIEQASPQSAASVISIEPPSAISKSRKHCSFHNVVFVKEIPSHRTYSASERFLTWYDDDDYRCFKLAVFLDRLQEMKLPTINAKPKVSADDCSSKQPQRKPSLDADNKTVRSLPSCLPLYQSPPPPFAKKSIDSSIVVNLIDDNDDDDNSNDGESTPHVKAGPLKKRLTRRIPRREVKMNETLDRIQREKELLLRTIDSQRRPVLSSSNGAPPQSRKQHPKPQPKKTTTRGARGKQPKPPAPPQRTKPQHRAERRQPVPSTLKDQHAMGKVQDRVISRFDRTGMMPLPRQPLFRKTQNAKTFLSTAKPKINPIQILDAALSIFGTQKRTPTNAICTR